MSEKSKAPVAEWDVERLKEHKTMLENKRSEIQSRINALESILEGKDE